MTWVLKITHYIKSNPKIILILIGICTTVYLMLYFQWDIRAITIWGVYYNVYTGLVALMDFIPIAGPLIVKVFNIPFFGLLIVGIILPQLMPSKKDMAEIC